MQLLIAFTKDIYFLGLPFQFVSLT